MKVSTKSMIAAFAADPGMIGIVAKIEKGIKAEHGHYGQYVSTIDKLTLGQPDDMRYIVGAAMVAAGANKPGVRSALGVLLEGGEAEFDSFMRMNGA